MGHAKGWWETPIVGHTVLTNFRPIPRFVGARLIVGAYPFLGNSRRKTFQANVWWVPLCLLLLPTLGCGGTSEPPKLDGTAWGSMTFRMAGNVVPTGAVILRFEDDKFTVRTSPGYAFANSPAEVTGTYSVDELGNVELKLDKPAAGRIRFAKQVLAQGELLKMSDYDDVEYTFARLKKDPGKATFEELPPRVLTQGSGPNSNQPPTPLTGDTTQVSVSGPPQPVGTANGTPDNSNPAAQPPPTKTADSDSSRYFITPPGTDLRGTPEPPPANAPRQVVQQPGPGMPLHVLLGGRPPQSLPPKEVFPEIIPPQNQADAIALLSAKDPRGPVWAARWLMMHPDGAPAANVSNALRQALERKDCDPLVVEALGTWGTDNFLTAVHNLLTAKEENDEEPGRQRTELQIAAIRLLGERKHMPAAEAIAQALVQPSTSAAARWALIELGPEVEDKLLPVINHGDPLTKLHVDYVLDALDISAETIALQSIEDLTSLDPKSLGLAFLHLETGDSGIPQRPRVAKVLLQLLRRTSGSVAERIAPAAQHWVREDEIEQVIALLSHSDPTVVNVATKILVSFDSPRAAEVLAEGLVPFFGRRHAMDVLRQMGSRAETALHPYLMHPERAVVEAAIQLLGDMGTSKSLSALKQAAKLTGRNESLANLIEAAIAKIRSRESPVK